ncbi:hypothetical protein BDN72DRAFT_777906, partial [Pluteus cervinus]
DHPFLEWIPLREKILAYILSLDSPGMITECSGCRKRDCKAYFRCTECLDDRVQCQTCVVDTHRSHPFHWVEEWNGSYFERVNLKDLGLQIHLGHPFGAACIAPAKIRKDEFIVLHTNGIHSVTMVFCACGSADHDYAQLLASRLFPATTGSPRTAATFQLLRRYQMLSFMSKISVFEFYQSLVRLTNNFGISVPVRDVFLHTLVILTEPKDRYKGFLLMVREWAHIRLMKRSGRGHDIRGIAGTRPGECALLCPACPHPGINLPENYNKLPNPTTNLLSSRWLYALFLGNDANFRLKRLDVSKDEFDPSLNDGSAYVVKESDYKDFIACHGESIATQTSTCNNHDAIKSANSRGGKGIASSGIATIDDARHDMKRPVSVGDLQKGERYVNVDYLFISSLAQNAPLRVSSSYDIACQWALNLLARVLMYGPDFDLGPRRINFMVPKFHIAAHRDECQANYSFYYTPYVGRTDGEAPERGWAAMNGIASSTKRMGPGSRRDTLDDHFGDLNWRKTVAMHISLLEKIQEAVRERSEQVATFLDLSESITVNHPNIIASWTSTVQKWEADPAQPNPFLSTKKKHSVNEVRLRLAEEDTETLNEGEDCDLVHKDISLGELFSQALEIEDQQRVLASDVKGLGAHSTSLQRAKIAERRNRHP